MTKMMENREEGTVPAPADVGRKQPATPFVPRRIDIHRQVYAERLIGDAMRAVEEMGADMRLTEAVSCLSQARTWVADFVDDVPPEGI